MAETTTTETTDSTPDLAKENADLKARLAALEVTVNQKSLDGKTLLDKARDDRSTTDDKVRRDKQLEQAITFNMRSNEFLKENEVFLPKDFTDIFTRANKDSYDDAIQKDQAIKSAMIDSFFQLQENADLLTPGQKSKLDEFLKLTKTGKQEQSQAVYDMVFEPAFDKLKSVKRAEALKKGHAAGSTVTENYKKRMIESSRKHYLGEKHGS